MILCWCFGLVILKIIPFASVTVHWDNDFENQPVTTPKSLFGSCISVTAGIYSSGFSVMQTWFKLLFPRLPCIYWHWSSSAPFFPTHSVLWGFPGVSYNLWICHLPKIDLQILLCIAFPRSLLNTASTGTGAQWAEVEAESWGCGSRAAPEPFSTWELPWPVCSLYALVATWSH